MGRRVSLSRLVPLLSALLTLYSGHKSWASTAFPVGFVPGRTVMEGHIAVDSIHKLKGRPAPSVKGVNVFDAAPYERVFVFLFEQVPTLHVERQLPQIDGQIERMPRGHDELRVSIGAARQRDLFQHIICDLGRQLRREGQRHTLASVRNFVP